MVGDDEAGHRVDPTLEPRFPPRGRVPAPRRSTQLVVAARPNLPDVRPFRGVYGGGEVAPTMSAASTRSAMSAWPAAFTWMPSPLS